MLTFCTYELGLHSGLRPIDLVAKSLASGFIAEVASTSTSSCRSTGVVGSGLAAASGSLHFSLFSSALPELRHFGYHRLSCQEQSFRPGLSTPTDWRCQPVGHSAGLKAALDYGVSVDTDD